MAEKSVYILHDSEVYGAAFSSYLTNPPTISKCHRTWKERELLLVSPEAPILRSLHPKHFLGLKNAYLIKVILFIDRVTMGSPAPSIIQIVDHRNLSGRSTLRGRTPIGNGPQFLDVSHAYSRIGLGLPQETVTTLGTDRFGKSDHISGEHYLSEGAAWVVLPAAYAGIEVVAIGWNYKMDAEGSSLRKFIDKHLQIGTN